MAPLLARLWWLWSDSILPHEGQKLVWNFSENLFRKHRLAAGQVVPIATTDELTKRNELEIVTETSHTVNVKFKWLTLIRR